MQNLRCVTRAHWIRPCNRPFPPYFPASRNPTRSLPPCKALFKRHLYGWGSGPSLNGWHRGEKLIQAKLNLVDPAVALLYTYIEGDLPEHHRIFHSTRLPFVPVTILDDKGRPWGSILAGLDGRPGFIRSPSRKSLKVAAKTWEGDPLLRKSQAFEVGSGDQMLVAGIGIDFSTRQRNKFAGQISGLQRVGNLIDLDFTVNQAIGNCPKYINIRTLLPHPDTNPIIASQCLHMSASERLPEQAVSMILEADTVFLGTVYNALPEDAELYPSHLGMNQRGGRPGFVRISPSDGRTAVLPDFSGNRFMTSLGNIEATPLASITILDFNTGSILYLTGEAKTLAGPPAQHIMPRQNTLTTLYVTGYTLVLDALPVRQDPSIPVQRSPYSPPIRLLAEEMAPGSVFPDEEKPQATLVKIIMYSPSIATFSWESSMPVPIKPGQAAVMDFTSLLGAPGYHHMAPRNPIAVNDDRIRTWTISSAAQHPIQCTRTFDITMREKRGGAVTGPLFRLAKTLQEQTPESMADLRDLGIRSQLVGITGDFTLPDNRDEPKINIPDKMLWVAGGIGVTPFLSMLSSLRTKFWEGAPEPHSILDIALVLSTREPEVVIPMISAALSNGSADWQGRLRFTLDVFSNKSIPEIDPGSSGVSITVRPHSGRVPPEFFGQKSAETAVSDMRNRHVWVCGPEGFEKVVIAALNDAGVDSTRIRREGFDY